MKFKTFSLLLAVQIIASGCAATPKTFNAYPSAVKHTTLCRTFLEAANAGNQKYAHDTATEAQRRGLTLEQCQSKVDAENAILIGVAVVATGAAAVAACQSGGCSGYSAPAYANSDYDCYGGGGDGPNYVRGPFRLNGPDIYDLDRDNDGIACEPFQDVGA